MTSARLSPAANLLRNSKLFALPATVPLPPLKPTAEKGHASDSATTPYPTRAAIYTTTASLAHGDWGLKRALPQKSFQKTTTPTIRINGGIDTQDHIADFESAADHVQTLEKWENIPVMFGNTAPANSLEHYQSVFAPHLDNTTASPSSISISRTNQAVNHRSWDDSERLAYTKPTQHLRERDSMGYAQEVFIGNLSEACTRDDVHTAFSRFGGIENVNLVHKPDRSGAPKCFAFVKFASPTAVDHALQSKVSIKGNKLLIEAKESNRGMRDTENGGLSLDETLNESLGNTLVQYTTDMTEEDAAAGRPPLIKRPQPPPVQLKPQRWRFKGPWLAGMSNLDFEEFIQRVDDTTINAFREHLKTGIIAHRQNAYSELIMTARANQEEPPPQPSYEVTEKEVDARLQHLRHKPNEFGPEMALFFDLPKGPKGPSGDHAYKYSLDATTISDIELGVPRMHPSAGFSYLRSTRFAQMVPGRGPTKPARAMPARILKDGRHSTLYDKTAIGVGGIVARVIGAGQDGRKSLVWQAVAGGKRFPVSLKHAVVLPDGTLDMGINVLNDNTATLDDKTNVPILTDAVQRSRTESRNYKQLPIMGHGSGGMGIRDEPVYKKNPALSEDHDEDMDRIMSSLSRPNGL